MGPAAAQAQQLAAPAPLEDRDDDAEGGGDGGDVHGRRLERDAEGPEGQQQEHAAEGDDHADEERQLPDDDLGEVVVGGRHTADVDLHGVAVSGGRDDVLAESVDEVARGPGLRGKVRYDGQDRGVAAAVEDGGAGGGDAVGRAQCLRQLVHGEPVARAVQPGDDGERAVGAGAEALRQQVVGLPGGGGGRVVALVGRAQVEGEGGQGQHQHDRGGDDTQQLGVPLDEDGPACGEAGGLLGARPLGGEPAALAAREGAHAYVREQGGQQGDRGGDREDHRHGGRYRDAVQEVQPQHQHAEQCDADGRSGEDDRPAGGGDGVCGRLLDRAAPRQALAVPGDDEQRVVDAHAEADEGAEHRGEVGDRHRVAEQGDAEIGGAHADQGGRDGQQARGERAEGEEEDQGRDDDADDLGEVCGGGLGELDGAAAQFDLETMRPRCWGSSPRRRRPWPGPWVRSRPAGRRSPPRRRCARRG